MRLEIDEATRDLPGSPNIPTAILTKIEGADIFVADITTINADGPSHHRRVPNPNVLFELGFAVAKLGWSRIILLVNQEFGDVALAPFDIDRQRVSTYRVKPDAKGKDLKAQGDVLTALMTAAVGAIIRANPPRASSHVGLAPEVIRRHQDIDKLRQLLECIHLPTIDQQIEEGPQLVPLAVFHFWESFDFILRGALFHIHDPQLLEAVRSFHSWWAKSLSHGSEYEMNRGTTACIFKDNRFSLTIERQREWDTIAQELGELKRALDDLLRIVRQSYLEVDIAQCSQKAWSEYRDFMARESFA